MIYRKENKMLEWVLGCSNCYQKYKNKNKINQQTIVKNTKQKTKSNGECSTCHGPLIARKMKFSITDFLSKRNQIRKKLLIWSHVLKKSENGNIGDTNP